MLRRFDASALLYRLLFHHGLNPPYVALVEHEAKVLELGYDSLLVLGLVDPVDGLLRAFDLLHVAPGVHRDHLGNHGVLDSIKLRKIRKQI